MSVNIGATTELDPKYIENQAAIPVEGVISTLEGVEKIETRISTRNARITVSFVKGTDVKYAYLKLEEKILTSPHHGYPRNPFHILQFRNNIRIRNTPHIINVIITQHKKRHKLGIDHPHLKTEDIGNIVVAEGPVLLKDIAEIHFGIKDEESYSRVNGKEVITCVVSKSPQVNVIELSERVREVHTRLPQSSFPPCCG